MLVPRIQAAFLGKKCLDAEAKNQKLRGPEYPDLGINFGQHI